MKSKNDLEWMRETSLSFLAVCSCRYLDHYDCQVLSEVEESPIDPKRPLSKRRALNTNSL